MWKFDGECQFGLAWRDRVFQPLSLFEVAIGLTRRNGAVLGQPRDRIGELIDMQQQVARAQKLPPPLKFEVIFCVRGVNGPPCGVPSTLASTNPCTMAPRRRCFPIKCNTRLSGISLPIRPIRMS